MWSSRDVALIIMFSAFNVVFQLLIGQVPDLITGIPGATYIFTIVYSISQTVFWLLIGGRRWRIVTKSLLVRLISFFLVSSGELSVTLPATLATILNSTIIDVVFNSYYESFRQKNKLLWWAILSQLFFWSTHTIWILVFSSLLFYPIEGVLQYWFIPVALVMLPVMIVESIAGGYIGYKIYRRVEKIV
jgi:hypothetical protein